MTSTVVAVNLVPMKAYSAIPLSSTPRIRPVPDVVATAAPNGTCDGLFIINRATEPPQAFSNDNRGSVEFYSVDVVFDGSGSAATWAVGRYGRGIRNIMEFNTSSLLTADRDDDDDDMKRIREVSEWANREDAKWARLLTATPISELFDELISDKLTCCVNSVLLPQSSSQCNSNVDTNINSDSMCASNRQVLAIVSSDMNGYTSQYSMFGSGDDGGLLAETLARLMPYLKSKKKKKREDQCSGPQLKAYASVKRVTFSSVDASGVEEMDGALALAKAIREAKQPIVKNDLSKTPDAIPTLPAFESVIASGTDKLFELEDVRDSGRCRVIASVDDALEIVSDAKLFDEMTTSGLSLGDSGHPAKEPPPYAAFVVLHLIPITADNDDRSSSVKGNMKKQLNTSSRHTSTTTKDVIIIFASFSNCPEKASKFAAELVYPTSTHPIILLAIPDSFDSNEQVKRVKQVLECCGDLPVCAGQSRALPPKEYASTVSHKYFPSARTCSELGELAAEVRLLRVATAPVSELVRLGLMCTEHTKKRSNDRESDTNDCARDTVMATPTVRELCSRKVESYRRRRRLLEGQLLDSDGADEMYRKISEDMTREAKKSKKTRVILEEELCKIKLESKQRETTKILTTSNFDDSDDKEEKIDKSSSETDSIDRFKAKQQDEYKATEEENKKLTANHNIMKMFYKHACVYTSAIQEFINLKRQTERKIHKSVQDSTHITLNCDLEQYILQRVHSVSDASLDTLSCSQSFSHDWFIRQMINDVLEYCVERATLIGEKVISINESYSWGADVQGASSRMKPPSMWIEQPLNILITELHPHIDSNDMSYPDFSCGVDDEEDEDISHGHDVSCDTPVTNNSITTQSVDAQTPGSAVPSPSKVPGKFLPQSKSSQSRRNSVHSNSGSANLSNTTCDGTQKYDSDEADKKYLMAVYDSLTLVQDVSRYLKVGTNMIKHGRNGTPHERRFWVATVSFKVELLWVDPTKNAAGDRAVASSISLGDVESVILGPFSRVFKRHPINISDPRFYLSFTLQLRGGRTIDVVAPSLADFEAWVLGLAHIARVDPFWGSKFDLTPYYTADPTLRSQISASEHAVCHNHFIIPAQYIAVKNKAQQIRDEVHQHLRLFANNEEHAFAALGGIHVPKTNQMGAILMTKGELRHHSSKFELDIFRVCEIWKLFSEMNIIYDPSFTSPTTFGVTKRKTLS